MRTIRICVILFIVRQTESYQGRCAFDTRCHCTNFSNQGTTDIDCSGKTISKFPKFPSSAIKIYFAYNLIKVIKNRTFENLRSLEVLDISFNRLSNLEQEAFIGLNSLKRLELQGNHLYYDTFSFPNNVFKPLTSLEIFDVRFAKYTRVPTNFPDKVVKDLKLLQQIKLDIRVSQSVPYPFGGGFSMLKYLRHLETGACYMNPLVTFGVFRNIRHFQYVDISSCRIESTYCLFCELKELTYLDISNNMLSILYMEGLVKDLNMMFSLKVLKMTNALQNNQDYHNFPTSTFDHLANTNISELHFNKNNFIRLAGDVNDTVPSTLRLLDFSSNKLIHFNIGMPFLIRLNLRNNSLGQFLTKNRLTTSTASYLKEIDLSFNSIFDLSASIFHAFPHLEEIDLSSNLLSQINFEISHLTVLRQLNLSINSIGSFNQNIMRIVDNLATESNLIIDLSNNNLKCDCQTMSFLKWMLDNQGHFHDIDKYKCKRDDETVVLNNFRNHVFKLQKDCASHTLLIVCVSLGISIACIIVMFGLVYRYRWKLRYMYYSTKSKYQRIQQLGSDNVYKYNAFISYSDTETNFILKELIPNLEEKWDMKLCVHQRDFIPGEEININITNAIQESNKTICIITKSFLESYYCMFEFNMARIESHISIYSRNGQNILLLVFYEQMFPRELPLVMLELVQQQSYIEYPHDEQGNILFWEKIKDAIK